jgi:uncharacterized protein
MIAGIPLWMAVGCVGIVFVGAAVQGTLGIGLGMIASPMLALADPAFIPGAIVIAVIPLSVSVAFRERAAIDRRGAALALAGRVPGVVAGSVAVALMGASALALLVAVSVLGAVIASLASIRFATTPGRLFSAGLASGFTGTATGVGGPPMALTYQHHDATTMRATLSTFFTAGAVMSIVGLAASGALGARQWQLAALLLPGVMLGYAASRVFATRLRDERTRGIVLALCATSAIALLIEEFV